jgi:hypothetical protein
MGTTMPLPSQAALNERTMRSPSATVASIGTRSLSCKLTPHAPTSASMETISIGGNMRAHSVAKRVASAVADRPQAEGELVFRTGLIIAVPCHHAFSMALRQSI